MNRRAFVSTAARYAALAAAVVVGLRDGKVEGKTAPPVPAPEPSTELPFGVWTIKRMSLANSPGYMPHTGPCDFDPESLRCVLCGKDGENRKGNMLPVLEGWEVACDHTLTIPATPGFPFVDTYVCKDGLWGLVTRVKES